MQLEKALSMVVFTASIFTLTACGDWAESHSIGQSISRFSAPVQAACPGLISYGDDLLDVRKEAAIERGFEGGEVTRFVVSERPTSLPSPLSRYSRGHHCEVNVSADQGCAEISKRACFSICTGDWQAQPEGVRRLFVQLTPKGCNSRD